MARTVITQPGQTLEDIALQEYGSVDGVTWLLLDNEDLLPAGYSSAITAGMKLQLRDIYADQDMFHTMRRLGVVPAAMVESDGPALPTGDDHNDDYNEDHG